MMTGTSTTGATIYPTTGGFYVSYSDAGMKYEDHDVEVSSETNNTKIKINSDGYINPKIYFSFVKSKLDKLEQDKLKRKLVKLQALVHQSDILKQDALYENLAKLLAITVRELEIQACGINQYVEKQHIEKYKNKVRDVRIEFSKLSAFPRMIPTKAASKITELSKKSLFDDFWVLYTEKKDAKKIETNEQKIARKDPILFGAISYAPDRFYYIDSWTDEYCDLDIDKFVDELKRNDPDFKLPQIPETFDKSFMESIKKEVMTRETRLQNTKQENFKELIKEEKAEREKRRSPKKKVSIFKKLFTRKKK